MGVAVKIEDIIAAMDRPEEWESFIDPETGEIVSLSEDDGFDLDDEDDSEAVEMPEWEQESVTRARKVLDSGHALALPGSFDIHEWELMRRFANSLSDGVAGGELLEAIHGAGAFRLFKMTVARLGLREAWFRYRHEAIRDLARSWLEQNGIEYVEEAQGEGS